LFASFADVSPSSPIVNGVVTFEQGYRQAMQAYEGLKSVEIDKDYIAPIGFHRPPEVLLSELKAHSQAIAAYMQFLQDKQAGKTPPAEVPAAA